MNSNKLPKKFITGFTCTAQATLVTLLIRKSTAKVTIIFKPHKHGNQL